MRKRSACAALCLYAPLWGAAGLAHAEEREERAFANVFIGSKPPFFSMLRHEQARQGEGSGNTHALTYFIRSSGAIGFSTSLATLHAFSARASVFPATVSDGIEDAYAGAGHGRKDARPFSLMRLSVIYHLFPAENTNTEYDSELNIINLAKRGARAAFVKYTKCDSHGLAPGLNKLWLQIDAELEKGNPSSWLQLDDNSKPGRLRLTKNDAGWGAP